MKKCNSCKKIKETKEFCGNKRFSDGLNVSCKSCNNERRRKKKGTYWKEQLKKENKKYCPKCDTVKSLDEFGNVKRNKDGKGGLCKICKAESDKIYRGKLRENNLYKKSKRNEYLRNIETYKNYTKNKVRDYKKEYADLRKSEIRYFKHSLRNRIYQAFKYRNMKKNTSTAKLLGCTFERAKEHIEMQFVEGMNWANYGQWHIDHIKPLALAETKQEMNTLFNYKNLQPLWAKDNLSKGCRF